jgi:hypothetical protein
MTKPNKRISQLEIERWLLGELDAEQKEHIEASLSVEERSAISSQDETLRRTLFERQPPRVFTAAVVASARKSDKRPIIYPIRIPALAISIATAIVIAIWVAPFPHQPGVTSPSAKTLRPTATERIKGLKPQLRIYRKRGSRAELLPDGTSVSAGDLLQLGYISAGRPYGIVLSVDGAGSVTLHAPADPSQSTRLMPGSGEHTLPTAYELDRAPTFERFFFLVSREPIDLDKVLSVVRDVTKNTKDVARKPLPLAGNIEQYSLLLLKNPS